MTASFDKYLLKQMWLAGLPEDESQAVLVIARKLSCKSTWSVEDVVTALTKVIAATPSNLKAVDIKRIQTEMDKCVAIGDGFQQPVVELPGYSTKQLIKDVSTILRKQYPGWDHYMLASIENAIRQSMISNIPIENAKERSEAIKKTEHEDSKAVPCPFCGVVPDVKLITVTSGSPLVVEHSCENGWFKSGLVDLKSWNKRAEPQMFVGIDYAIKPDQAVITTLDYQGSLVFCATPEQTQKYSEVIDQIKQLIKKYDTKVTVATASSEGKHD